MSEQTNPIAASVSYLEECGWSPEEARNLVRAIYDKEAERLWEMAPRWIETVGEAKRNMALYDVVALGLATVRRADDDSDWTYALSDRGLSVGAQLAEGA